MFTIKDLKDVRCVEKNKRGTKINLLGTLPSMGNERKLSNPISISSIRKAKINEMPPATDLVHKDKMAKAFFENFSKIFLKSSRKEMVSKLFRSENF